MSIGIEYNIYYLLRTQVRSHGHGFYMVELFNV